MNVVGTLRGLLRRWYIVVPGILLAAGAAFGAWQVVSPGYERSATQLLLPGAESLPENANPFLFLGGLSNAADVLVRAVSSENVMNAALDGYTGVDVEVSRDGSTAGPVVLITVTAETDADAEAVLGTLVDETVVQLEQMQERENVQTVNRITVVPITVDDQSTLQQRDRLVAAAAAGVGVLALSIVLAALLDGLTLQRRRRASQATSAESDVDEPVASSDGGPADDRGPGGEGLGFDPTPDAGERESVMSDPLPPTQETPIVRSGGSSRHRRGARRTASDRVTASTDDAPAARSVRADTLDPDTESTDPAR
ncbi:hypothetical protein [Microbacterium sp. SLBN-146]|uniref:hypothetical protein n=1 Tax=Microbacterium sp. SLBN-146 TaxID=2768457 RepID=UPI0011681642|nr:hypothetical protein [Microbacterium sp. SLBN-146]TQJ30604.1 hypothetical protein FBY39_1057 [Microbacterium sp. SLBN-146]